MCSEVKHEAAGDMASFLDLAKYERLTIVFSDTATTVANIFRRTVPHDIYQTTPQNMA